MGCGASVEAAKSPLQPVAPAVAAPTPQPGSVAAPAHVPFPDAAPAQKSVAAPVGGTPAPVSVATMSEAEVNAEVEQVLAAVTRSEEAAAEESEAGGLSPESRQLMSKLKEK